MSMDDKKFVLFDIDTLPPGRIDPDRLGKPNPNDTEARPVITAEDIEATRRYSAGRRQRAKKDHV
jgi:hypothetical protein